MQTPLREIVAVQARTWSGIEQPNEAAGIMADALAASIAGFTALRGQLAFEDEPSSFEAALQETKEPQP
ncbi:MULTISPECIES: hypothetical protein [unclassified Bosea (in: a-proteobacteria)]|jgi:hypothetical protein|uniref:hypothetical protein n=1 Tax=unclassified Bosea (in: a-proteobacteria) TaxID=2653178 RepID=UPI000856A111|nr:MULTISPECIES: hypothetical protein [unclassified Bosea (in: a-proteobacteria)]AOG06515.1 hypothetical protein BSY19_759 [Bosea sp. RAC05]OYW62679.1 MAG: hypothetical protein B7Z40_16330 [Bosea sp. 12-68-7]WRH57370.1 MAG: hypothetical protein RSE11_20645 [Bosea sp. (in: a-proteobacteria)]